jgi:hypothetical protein
MGAWMRPSSARAEEITAGRAGSAASGSGTCGAEIGATSAGDMKAPSFASATIFTAKIV